MSTRSRAASLLSKHASSSSSAMSCIGASSITCSLRKLRFMRPSCTLIRDRASSICCAIAADRFAALASTSAFTLPLLMCCVLRSTCLASTRHNFSRRSFKSASSKRAWTRPLHRPWSIARDLCCSIDGSDTNRRMCVCSGRDAASCARADCVARERYGINKQFQNL